MKTELPGSAASLAILLIAGILALTTTAPAQSADACDCSCSRYGQLLETMDIQPQQSTRFLDRCAGACAIAWTQCEVRFGEDDDWPSATTEADAEETGPETAYRSARSAKNEAQGIWNQGLDQAPNIIGYSATDR